MKKQGTLCLVSALAISFFLLPVRAEEPMRVQADRAEGRGGSEVRLDISLVNNPGIASGKLTIDFCEKLGLTGVEYNKALGGMAQKSEKLTSPLTLNWISGIGSKEGDLVFASLIFCPDEDLAEGVYPLYLSAGSDDWYNESEENISFVLSDGGILLLGDQALLLGDLDNNQVVNEDDLSLMKSFLVGNGPAVRQMNADLNRDGLINTMDLLALKRVLKEG